MIHQYFEPRKVEVEEKDFEIIEAKNQCKLPASYKNFLKNNETSFIDLPENCYIGIEVPEFSYWIFYYCLGLPHQNWKY
jgi:hypothetical protein